MEGFIRVFAGEYGGSTLSIQGIDSQSPPWVVTPGGGYCRFMFLSGTLTEVSETGDMVNSRIADPTGVFNLVIGGRNTALAETFRNLPIPSFVTVTGRSQMYQKDGRYVLSVRPDSVQNVNRQVRDQWVLSTAQSTLGRLFLMNQALQGACPDERVLAAFHHYSITKFRLKEFAAMVVEAVNTVQTVVCGLPVQQDVRTRVMDLIRAGSGPKGISVDEIITQGAACGISRESALAIIESLIIDDECYQPLKGFVKPL
jgi:RPA family protein